MAYHLCLRLIKDAWLGVGFIGPDLIRTSIERNTNQGYNVTYTEEQALIKVEAAKFPEEFGLRAFPDDIFRVSVSASYYTQGFDNDYGKQAPGVLLYTQILQPDGKSWEDFAKGTTSELLVQVVELPND